MHNAYTANLMSEILVFSVNADDIEGEGEDLESSLDRKREGKFLLYWMTTTLTSTSTSYTATSTLATLDCTPTSYSLSQCGKK